MGLFSSSKSRGQIRWGDVVIPQNLANYHFLAAGATGTGKSTLLRILLRSVLPDVKEKSLDTRFLIYDAKTEVCPDLAERGLTDFRVLLNPFDMRCSAWDVGRDIQGEGQAQELAAVMVPTGEGQNKYFYDASRLMIKTAALALMKAKGTGWTFRDLLLACSNVSDLKKLTVNAKLPGVEVVEDFLDPSKEVKSVRMTLAVENNSFNTIAAAWDLARNAKPPRTFSIHDWVASPEEYERSKKAKDTPQPRILVLGASKQARTALATVNRLLVQRIQQVALDYVRKDEEDQGGKKKGRSERRTWVFLDEFPTLGTIPYLEEMLTEGRSRGICTVLGLQHIAHVQRWYGGMANALLGQCLHQAYFRANDAEMAEWCARHFGLLISYEDDPDKPPHAKTVTNAATVNNFLFMELATREAGFECIVRSSKAALPGGPKKVRVGPRSDLEAVDATVPFGPAARFVPWLEKLELKAWDESERDALNIGKQEAAPGVPILAPDRDLPFKMGDVRV